MNGGSLHGSLVKAGLCCKALEGRKCPIKKALNSPFSFHVICPMSSSDAVVMIALYFSFINTRLDPVNEFPLIDN